ncbi:reverse transcriptase (RNA-dependent DNA polymerase) domain-containing protein [Phthorimaea operculella]|nr:reverse transcriptase (RNA-dependent DNA polymerase) domain-containing protein [Phthorimaea operculella]
MNGERICFVRFADDIAALAESSEQLQQLLTYMDETFKEFGLKINIGKTKTLTTSKTQTSNAPISLNNSIIEQVNSFRYLGSLITHDSRCTADIISRIAIAKNSFKNKKNLLTSKISKKVRKRLIKTYVWSIALYASETWTMTQRDRERLEAFEMWCWRRMEKISWTEKKTNDEVLHRVNEKRCLLRTIENRRGKMIGHLMRHDNFWKNIVEGKIEGSRGRGRPRRNYFDQIKEKVNVVSYREVKSLAERRQEWQLLHRQELSS